MTDFRSDRMPSPEGRGIARAAWDKYTHMTNKAFGPSVEKVFGKQIQSYSTNTVTDLVGFWVMWHMYGGFEGLLKLGMSRSAIYRRVTQFRSAFGSHPDEFDMRGVELNRVKWFNMPDSDTNEQP